MEYPRPQGSDILARGAGKIGGAEGGIDLQRQLNIVGIAQRCGGNRDPADRPVPPAAAENESSAIGPGTQGDTAGTPSDRPVADRDRASGPGHASGCGTAASTPPSTSATRSRDCPAPLPRRAIRCGTAPAWCRAAAARRACRHDRRAVPTVVPSNGARSLLAGDIQAKIDGGLTGIRHLRHEHRPGVLDRRTRLPLGRRGRRDVIVGPELLSRRIVEMDEHPVVLRQRRGVRRHRELIGDVDRRLDRHGVRSPA